MKKIMIVDDEISILDVLERFLNRSGKVTVTTNSNPEIALSTAINESYDLILVDIMMPTVDGLQLLEKIKQNNQSTKVILMTAYSTEKKSNKAKELNADGYIEKPFENLKDIENIIFSTLNI